MIEVRHLTKRYGPHTAVSDLSFTIEKGVIYGFLGPNGAGKSTTMNILTGCLGATEGEVLVDGLSIRDNPKQAKKKIGYLPELPPLYVDMTGYEYLSFVAEVKGVPAGKRKEEIARVMEKTGITEVSERLIKNLSKGFRQRVGIAQALLGNPEVIILDEPTVGLDPGQIIEIRDLIRELGKEHTIILSSHILSEVQAVCESIMIISQGKLVASDTPENLMRLFAGTVSLQLEIKGGEEAARGILDKVEGIEKIQFLGRNVMEDERKKAQSLSKNPASESTSEEEAEGQGEEKNAEGKANPQKASFTTLWELIPREGEDIREELFLAFAKARMPILEMRLQKASLENVFLELTQSEERPEGQRGEEKNA